MKKHSGFTLIELMITVVVIAILAAIALPMYQNYVMSGKLAEAKTQLSDLRVKLEQFYQDNRNYGTNTCGTDAGGTVRVAIPQAGVQYFTYACVLANAGQGYTITAAGVASQGVGSFAFTIDQDNNKVTTAVPTGWVQPNPNTCWVTKANGSC